MLLNEFAQWAGLICLGIFVLGLTRQLGVFLVPKQEQKAIEVGPDVGKRFPRGFLTSAERTRLLDELEASGREHATLLVVSERCPSCHALLDELAAERPRRPALAVLARDAGPEFRQLLERVAGLVVVDGPRLDAVNLTVGPLALLVDRELRLQAKQLVFDARQLADLERPLGNAAPVLPAREPSPGLAVVTVDRTGV